MGKSFLKSVLKVIFNLFGFQLIRLSTLNAPIVYHEIDLVFDIGANVGQYGKSIRSRGYKGTIVSFEPLPDAHKELQQCARNDTNWIVHDRCALGSKSGITAINISKNSYSSSILQILRSHTDSAPESRFIGKVETPVATLDSIFARYAGSSRNIMLKVDTQGFEHEVMLGSLESISRIKLIQLELSLVPLYEGQKLYDYFVDFLEQFGFVLWKIEPGFTNPSSGQLLQFDATFLNLNLANLGFKIDNE